MMRRIFRGLLAVVIVIVAAIFVLRLVFPLPDISQRAPQTALPVSAGTVLGQRVLAAQEGRPDLSGVMPLANGHDALTSRLALIDQASQSVDAQ